MNANITKPTYTLVNLYEKILTSSLKLIQIVTLWKMIGSVDEGVVLDSSAAGIRLTKKVGNHQCASSAAK